MPLKSSHANRLRPRQQMKRRKQQSAKNRKPPSIEAPLGAHVSIAGGSHNAPARAKAIGATAMQIFTKMASRWAERVCEDDECRAFLEALSQTEVRETSAHDSSLINLASPDPVLRARSIESFSAELAR